MTIRIGRRPEQRITLHPREVAGTRRLRRGGQLCCLSGRFWITFVGDPHDYVIGAGEQLDCSAGCRATIVALEGGSLLLAQKKTHTRLAGVSLRFSRLGDG